MNTTPVSPPSIPGIPAIANKGRDYVMSISGVDLIDIEDELREMVDVLKQRNEIEKEKLDVLKKIKKALRMESDR